MRRFGLALLLLLPIAGGCERLERAAAPDAGADATRGAGMRVKLELLQKLGTDALHIDVDAAAGRITLNGEVRKRATAELAAELARKVAGVTEVRDNLRVSGAPEPTSDAEAMLAETERELADAALEVRVGLALVDRLGSDGFRIGTDAASGVVTLEFPAAIERSRRKDAVATAEKVDGVQRVIAVERR